ncbi:RING-H2 finger protein ATL78-like [Cynara cardunculus var. scolymus]|uniref:RING-H2 finger protein ATL78-like n=1 Tax=Cynara cardunculus var. scolymus TaxID=59895 RepID=UPI000D62EB31|nr:RING-H2 finger protein ATL78-like [Cynara cardunculus var. scolymus]
MSTSFTTAFQGHLGHSHSRKLLLHAPIATTMHIRVEETATSPTPSQYTKNKSFDANVVMVLSVLLCSIICMLVLNSIIRCVLRCSSMVNSGSDTGSDSTPARLASSGIKKKALKALPTVRYWEGLKLPGLDKECAICLSEFVPEELIKILPKCNHGFHVRCIDKWLSSHTSCPTCRHCLKEAYQTILSDGACSKTTSTTQVQRQEPEGISTIIVMPL